MSFIPTSPSALKISLDISSVPLALPFLKFSSWARLDSFHIIFESMVYENVIYLISVSVSGFFHVNNLLGAC